MSKVTVVVPTYNVEKYISKCLDSLVSQDFDDYKIMVVNDGSPANEQAIIDEYAVKYDKIIPIVKENGGYGSVLQLAFSKIDSEYVLICDPDDWLNKDAISTLVKAAEENDADLTVGAKYLVFSDDGEETYDKSFNEEFGILKPNTVYKAHTKEFDALYFLEPSPHAKLYKTEMVKKCKFPFKVSYTDNLLYFLTLARSKKVVYVDKAVSYYLINREGNTRTDLRPTVIDAWLTVFKSIMSQTENFDDIFYYRMFEAFKSIYYKVDQINADKALYEEKLRDTYEFLELLLPHRKQIISKMKEYDHSSTVMNIQQKLLLNSSTSKWMFNRLVKKRLAGKD